MNATLEQYVSQFETLGEDAQLELTRRLQIFFDEQEIDRRLLASEKRGGKIPVEEVFARLDKKLSEEYGL